MQQKIAIIEKNPRILRFPKDKQREEKQMAYLQAKQLEHTQKQKQNPDAQLSSDFFVSLLNLEPKSQLLPQPSLILVKTLVDSYQLIITQLHKTQQEGLALYFQQKLNNLLEQPQIKSIIQASEDKDMIQILNIMESSVKIINCEEEIQIVPKVQKANSLQQYISMQEKLEVQQHKALQMIEEFDEQNQQIEQIVNKDLGQQEQKMHDRLKKRSKYINSINQAQIIQSVRQSPMMDNQAKE